jgi:hypothetical protein
MSIELKLLIKTLVNSNIDLASDFLTPTDSNDDSHLLLLHQLLSYWQLHWLDLLQID